MKAELAVPLLFLATWATVNVPSYPHGLVAAQTEPKVTIVDDFKWRIVSGGRTREYVANNPNIPVIVDKKRQRIIVPTSEFIVGLDFECHALWKYDYVSAFDPRPLMEIGGIVIAGVNRMKDKRFAGTRDWAWIVESDRKTVGVVGLDARSGRRIWKTSILAGGSPLIAMDDRSFLSLRMVNESGYLRGKEDPRYRLETRDASTGKKLLSWEVSHPTWLLEEALGQPLSAPTQGRVHLTKERGGWKVKIEIGRVSDDVPDGTYLELTLPEKGRTAGYRVVKVDLEDR